MGCDPQELSLSEQATPAPYCTAPWGQATSSPSCRQCARDSSVPEHFTPLKTTLLVKMFPCQYQVSWMNQRKKWPVCHLELPLYRILSTLSITKIPRLYDPIFQMETAEAQSHLPNSCHLSVAELMMFGFCYSPPGESIAEILVI